MGDLGSDGLEPILWVRRPNQQCHGTEGHGQSTTSRANPTMLSLPKGKGSKGKKERKKI